jgi:hypothetical protein
LAVPLPDRDGWIPAHRNAAGDIPDDPATGRNPHLVADPKMTGDTYLASGHHKIAKNGTAGDAGLPRQRAAPSKSDVVGDVNLFVEAGSFPDYCIPRRSAVDGAVGADIGPVAQDHPAKLWHGHESRWIRDKAEALLANSSPLLDADADAGNAMADRRERPNAAVVAERNTCTEHRAGPDYATRSEGDPVLDHGAGFHRAILTKDRACRDVRRR